MSFFLFLFSVPVFLFISDNGENYYLLRLFMGKQTKIIIGLDIYIVSNINIVL